MKRLIQLFISVSLIIFLQGCLEVKTVVNVNADGGGTVEETVLLSSDIVAMISQFSDSLSQFADSLSQDTSAKPPFSIFNEAELKNDAAKFGTGVKYVSGESIKQDGKEGYRAVYSFNDISGLIIDQNPGDKVSMGQTEEQPGVQKDPVKFAFLKGPPPVVTINLPGLNLNDSSMTAKDSSSFNTEPADSNSFNQLLGMMKDLKMSTIIKVNGTILETNATYVEGSNITLLNINFGELMKNMSNLNDLKKINIQNIQQVKAFIKNLKGIQMETNTPVSIIFK